MKVYTYNPITGVLIGTSDAEESQLEPGTYLMPAYSTDIVPPEFNEITEIVYFDLKLNNWKKQNIESEPEINLITETDVDRLKSELLITRSKKEDVLKKIGLTQKEIDLLLVNLPTEDVLDNLIGKPIPINGLPTLLPPEE